jgi:uncharacterized membrane protein
MELDEETGTTMIMTSTVDIPESAAPGGPVPAVRHRGSFIEMLISSLLSLTASLVLSVDAIRIAKNPYAQLSCNINAHISCTAVARTWQANLLGFPNAFLGLIAEPIVITVAIASLCGVIFPRNFMRCAQAIYTIGLGFAGWLFIQSYFVIGALCPWCLLVTTTTTLVWFSLTRVNVLQGHLPVPRRVRWWFETWVDHVLAAIIVAVLITAIALEYFS